MSQSMSFRKLTCLFAAAAALAACGGGDDTPAPPPAVTYTQADVLTTAQLGALTVGISQLREPFLVTFFGGFMQVASTDGGGTGPYGRACPGGGTQTGTITKSAVRVGFAAGDSIATTYTNCVVGALTIDGTVLLTARNPIANLDPSSYSADYTAEVTGFSIAIGGLTTVHNGRIDATSAAQGDAVTSSFQVPANATYGSLSSGFAVLFSAGATFAETETTSTPTGTGTGTLAINGTVTISAGSMPIPLQMSTGPILSGPTNAGVLEVTGGTLNTKDTVLNIATSTVFTGSTATVSGDTDQNGSLDLTFASSWTALTN